MKNISVVFAFVVMMGLRDEGLRQTCGTGIQFQILQVVNLL
jgi:hypothetical protein